jgi:hypothetical protein
VLITIPTGGTDIHIMERPNGGYTIKQGHSYLLVTLSEAVQLAASLRALTPDSEAVSPAKARLVRYASGEPA